MASLQSQVVTAWQMPHANMSVAHISAHRTMQFADEVFGVRWMNLRSPDYNYTKCSIFT